MNIAYLLVVIALFALVLAVRGMTMKAPNAVIGNLCLALSFGLVAIIAYPHHASYLHERAAELARIDHQIELDRIKALNAAFINPEITREYLKDQHAK
jgi:uncharacterized membrane protein